MWPEFYVKGPVQSIANILKHYFIERKPQTKLTKRPDLRHNDEYFNQVRMSSSGETTRECTWIIFCQSSTILWHPLIEKTISTLIDLAWWWNKILEDVATTFSWLVLSAPGEFCIELLLQVQLTFELTPSLRTLFDSFRRTVQSTQCLINRARNQ